MDDKYGIFEEIKVIKVNKCMGRIYRCYVNVYLNKREEYVCSIKMSPLKKLSCPGCEKCGWVDEYLPEFATNDLENYHPMIKGDIINMGLYRLEIIDTHKDWETGIVDDVEIHFVEIK